MIDDDILLLLLYFNKTGAHKRKLNVDGIVSQTSEYDDRQMAILAERESKV